MKTCTTYHEFLDAVPIEANTEYLILGTIHPYSPQGTKNFLCHFFYGNQYSLWGILKEAFPHLPIDAKKDIACRHQAAEKIKAMLRQYHIAISDVVQTAVRPDNQPTADHFLAGTEYHEELIEQIRHAQSLKTIFFTGRKVLDIFRSLYLKAIRKEGLSKLALFPKHISSADIFTLNDEVYLHKQLCCILLPSPSSGAVRGKSRAFVQSGCSDYAAWRLDFYREAFGDIFAKR